MKKFRTVASVIIMVIAGIVGFFIGVFLNEPMAGTILFSMIAGIACIVYAIDNHEEQGKFKFVTEVTNYKQSSVFLKNICDLKMGNFNRPSENTVFQMEQINICKVDISVVSER